MFYSNLSKTVALSVGVLAMVFLIGYFVFAWTEPTQAPPGGNVPAPLNVSLTAQSKEGALVIGSNIGPGTGNPGITTALVVPYANVGIGTTEPYAKLNVLNLGEGTSFRVDDNGEDVTPFLIDANGKVGIGTTAPGSTLTVRSSSAGTVFAVRNTGDTANNFTISDAGSAYMTGFQLGTSATAGHVLTTNASGVGTWQAPTGGGGGGYWALNGTNIYNTNTGNVGIGTQTPNNLIQVKDLISFNDTLYSTALGRNALFSNTTGNNNTALGRRALRSNTTANGNTALGVSALSSNTIGTENTAVGQNALSLNTTGNYNTAVGYNALFYSNPTDRNTAVGFQALYANTTGNNNAALGYSALIGNTTGSYNTAIGYQADVVTGSLTNATAIGYGTMVSCSNCLVLGNNNTNVGIGTASPGTKLAVVGLTGISSGVYMRYLTDGTGRIYYYSSSAKYKDDIRVFQGNFYKILEAEPRSFIDKVTGERNIGYIAEEFDALGLKELVGYKDGHPDTLNYELISLYLVEIMKEQQKQIEELKTETQRLNSSNL